MYTLRFPFLLGNNTSINDLESPLVRDFNELEIKLEFKKPYYILIINGFDTEDKAKSYLKNLKIGLHWASLNCNFGFESQNEFDNVYYPPDPKKAAENFKLQFGIDKGEQMDCVIGGNAPSVYPTKAVIGTITGGMSSFTIGKNPNSVLDSFIEGLSISISEDNFDPKLQIAIDIYNNHFFEQSNQSKFLSLVMALECISPHNAKHKIAQDLIDSWALTLSQKIELLDQDSEEHHSLESLKKEINFRREASLRSQIRALVNNTLTKSQNPLAIEYSKKAVKVYDIRSKLVHDGVVDLKILETSLADAREIVLLVLQSKLRNP